MTQTRTPPQLDRVIAVETGPYPVVSLYLDLRPDDRGRDSYAAFVRSAFKERLETYPAEGPERDSLVADAQKISQYLEGLDRTANGLALFACAGADLFEAIELAAPIPSHGLYVSDAPHLYPLARVLDQFPRYAVVVADTSDARIFVIAANAIERAVQGPKFAGGNLKNKRHKQGGWSQARYQRHVDHFRIQHAKEVVEVLTRIVRDEQIPSIVIGGDEVIVPMLRNELPKDMAERVADVVALDIHAPEHEILSSSLEALRRKDEQTDRERVEELIDAYRAHGLATVGVSRVTQALDMGQVHELVISARSVELDGHPSRAADVEQEPAAERSAEERAADDLIVKAGQTGAAIRFIEDPELLKPYGGVGAFLRFTLNVDEPA